ncbi:MAG: hypothetical protein ABIJ09_15685 [Pseudomonadota bacterium]
MSTHDKVRIDNDSLVFNDGTRVTFQRTLRIPDDDKRYPLPPGLGAFPLRRVQDYADRVPAEWRDRGGVFLPMFQREALWICLSTPHWKPRAVKVGIGKVCALTGQPWSDSLHTSPQDYLVTPPQPWLDGICVAPGVIRQFVAMPLGMGYSVEGQVTGQELFGGMQLQVYEPRPGRFPDHAPYEGMVDMACDCEEATPCGAPAPSRARSAGAGMGLAAGGRMTQKIYPDPHGVETWDPHNSARIFVHIVNSERWREITGEEPPATPVTARSYSTYGLPWFDLYDEGAPTLKASPTLATVHSIKCLDHQKFGQALQDDDPVVVPAVRKLYVQMIKILRVRDGDW